MSMTNGAGKDVASVTVNIHIGDDTTYELRHYPETATRTHKFWAFSIENGRASICFDSPEALEKFRASINSEPISK